MKKVFLTIAAIAGFMVTSNAQNVRVGVKGAGGVSLGTLNLEGASNIENKIGLNFSGGALAEFSFRSKADKFKMQVEALYNHVQTKNDFVVLRTKIKGVNTLHAVSVPLLAKYFFTPSFSLYAGPTFNFNLASNYKMNDTKLTSVDDPNLFQLGGAFGANYYVWKGLFVEAKYNALLPDMYEKKANNPNFGTISNIQLGVGFKF